MLFTLRLLPCTKVWAKRLIYFTLFLNFAITVIASVSYGVRCLPFSAIGDVHPKAKCITTEVLVSTMKLNGSEYTISFSSLMEVKREDQVPKKSHPEMKDILVYDHVSPQKDSDRSDRDKGLRKDKQPGKSCASD